MDRGQEKKHTRKLGKKKQRRNRRFWECVTSHRYGKILEFARYFTRNLSDAQDLAQIAILRLLKYCPKPVRIISLDAYILATVRNASRDSQRPQTEISFSELKKKDESKMAVLDPNISRFLETCDIKALVDNTESTKLSDTKELIAADLNFPRLPYF